MKFHPFPELETERLLLRKIRESDDEVIFFLRTDEEVTKYIHREEEQKTKTKEDASKFIQKITKEMEDSRSISWGITLKNDPDIIGTICLWNFSEDLKTAEIGYDLLPEFQRKGFMNEALNRVVDFGFTDLAFDRIEAFTNKENRSSIKLLVSNGFLFMADRKDEEDASNNIYCRHRSS